MSFGPTDNLGNTINTPGLDPEDKLAALKREFGVVMGDSAQYILRIYDMDDVRFCRWLGQSVDGRKWADVIGKQPFPWNGAADARVWYVDDIINDDVDIMMGAMKRGHMQTTATNMSDASYASAVNVVLDYVTQNEMAGEWEREIEFAANWRQHIGSSVIQTDWYYRTGTEVRTITMQDIWNLSKQDPALEGLLRYIAVNHSRGIGKDDLQAAEQKLLQYFPDIKNPQAALQSLEQTGSYQYDAPYLMESRPTITALAPCRDVFFPMNTYDLQKSRWIVRRDVLTLSELNETATIEQWDPEFLEGVKRFKGMSVLINYINSNRSVLRRNKDLFVDEFKEMYEVFYCYSDEFEDGARKIMVTIFHPSLDTVGAREISPYEHGKKPFTVFRREKSVRSIIESRGVSDIAETGQNEIKIQRDSRTDRTSISTIPPLKKPASRAKTSFKLGPACEITEIRPGEISFLEMPPMDQGTIEVEMSVRQELDSYFGKTNGEAIDPNKILRKQQRLADGFLGELKEVVTQIGQLCQQFMAPEDWARICNVKNSPFTPMSREDIQKEFHVTFSFDARDLNMEYAQKKLEMVETVASFDHGGSIDYDYLTRWGMMIVDPTFADQGLKPPNSVTQKEIEDEQNAVVKISLGIEPPVPTSGANFQLRLQVIQNTLQTSPIIQKLIMGDQTNQQILENRAKAFTFQIDQQKNAQIGRTGVQPVLPNGPQASS